MQVLSACRIAPPVSGTQTLTLFAAASLAQPFEAIGEAFERDHPDVDLVLVFAGSQSLAQQIVAGAKPDVFASANLQQMEFVIDSGLIDPAEVMVFTSNQLEMITPSDNPAGLKRLQDLAKPGLRVVIAAQEVPVGYYTLQFLNKSAAHPDFPPDYQADVLRNVVSYENDVKAVLAKVSLGEADAGIVYVSDRNGRSSQAVNHFTIPEALNVRARYPIAPLETAGHPDTARAFIEFVLSPRAQAVLADYGFLPISDG